MAKELSEDWNINPMAALLMSGRGYNDPFEVDCFFSDEVELSDPFILPDMQKAVERIWQALKKHENIAVYGDYDADGVTSSALLFSFLRKQGANVVCYIPERLEDGYGLHRPSIDLLHDQKVSLIITVDNGISALDEVAYAGSLGIDVVVTDHHLPGDELPPAVAVVDPHLLTGLGYDGFTDYAGVGVTFKLVCALEQCPPEELLAEYGDLLAIGTVADVVPLKDENRTFVKQGLQVLNRMERVGLRELVLAAELNFDELSADHIAFGIAPRINAAGRMGKSRRAFDLLVTDDIENARALAAEICYENARRQEVESCVFEACCHELVHTGNRLQDRVLVVAGENWHHGVLGIVAARLCTKYGKPAIVLSVDGETAKGSGRSLDGFDLFDALRYTEKHLIQLGGHTLAAGLTLKADKIDDFRKAINEYAVGLGDRPVPVFRVDCKLTPMGANDQTAGSIRCMAPFGRDNPVPVFALTNMQLAAITPVGGGKSLRLTLQRDGHTVVCMRFSTSLHEFPYMIGDVIDVGFVFRYGTYKGKPAYSIVVQEMRPSQMNEENRFREMLLYEEIVAKRTLPDVSSAGLIPSRDQMGALYRYLRQCKTQDVTLDQLYLRTEKVMSPGQILVALDVFEEFGFVSKTDLGDVLRIQFENPQGKFDLSNSEILNQFH